MPVVNQNGIYFGYDAGQDNWGAQTNNSLRKLAYVGLASPVRDVGITNPPATPVIGDRYILGVSATGAWSGIPQNTIVVWGYGEATGNTPAIPSTPAWQRFSPELGLPIYNQQTNRVMVYNGTAWVELQNSAVNIRTDATLQGDGTTSDLGIAPAYLFSPTEKSKLAGIENNATADQSASQIRNRLQGLTGSSRLRSSAIQGLDDLSKPGMADSITPSSRSLGGGRSEPRVKVGELNVADITASAGRPGGRDDIAYLVFTWYYYVDRSSTSLFIDIELRRRSSAAIGATTGAGSSVLDIRTTRRDGSMQGTIRQGSSSIYGDVQGSPSVSGNTSNLIPQMDVWLYRSEPIPILRFSRQQYALYYAVNYSTLGIS